MSTGATREQIEAAARRQYEALPNAKIYPSWADLPETKAQAMAINRYPYNTHRDVLELFSKRHHRSSMGHAAQYLVPPGSAIIDAEDVAEARRIVAGWDDGTLDDRNTARQAVALLRRIGGEG